MSTEIGQGAERWKLPRGDGKHDHGARGRLGRGLDEAVQAVVRAPASVQAADV
ncbi:MAG: hypothetical protein WBA72_12995 [Ornithinimicrobium sp.]